MTIRQATLTDAQDLLAFLMALAAESAYTQAAPADRAGMQSRLDQLLHNSDAGFFVAEDHGGGIVGLFAILLYTDLISGERGVAQICWYTKPAYRRGLGPRLLAHGVAWATAHGARRIQMLAPEKKFERFYQRHGYTPTNRVYEGRLSCRG